MGLFNRQKAVPSQPAMKQEAEHSSAKELSWVSTEAYTYDELVKLMRDIPVQKKDMVLRILVKTLRSGGIDPAVFLDEGYRRLELLREQNERLHRELEELETSLLQRKAEIFESGLERETLLHAERRFAAVLRKA